MLLCSATLLTLPGIYCRLASVPLSAPLTTLISGVAILGSSFILLWACDGAQAEISQALALAVVALVAVLPEYAVDMYFTWQAGKNPVYAHFAIANMTGANRLLIGVAWVVVVIIFWFKTRKPVRIEKERRTELLFLGLATVYAFIVTIKGQLAWYDGVVFLGIYVWYMSVAGRRPCEYCVVEGPAEILVTLPKHPRRLATAGMFIFSAFAILANARPFSEGLIQTGSIFHISQFLLVQWLAPIASEAPEFIVAIIFSLRGKAGLALGSLLSAKLNQWTLLVGMIPGVYAISHGGVRHSIPMNSFQMHEILLTAAQSLLAVIMLAALRLNIRQALLLFVLFIGQLIAPYCVQYFPHLVSLGLHGERVHELFSLMYVVAALTLFLKNPKHVMKLWKGHRIEQVPSNVADTEPIWLEHKN
jgi:cation:H+ antiporter